ncbi:hypothetical protein AB0N29_00985 [Nocardioides sp. NPDC092400]|uniref:hypothetical protein n=1 Tax=Nocardioides sp. NPDC092400 TaxID=3155196 RepID=UPI00343DA0A6
MAYEGIEGVDLVELDIISKERLPAVADDFRSAESLVHEGSTTAFERSGPIGNYPLGPSAEWGRLAGLLNAALETSIGHLDDTSAAIQVFLADILAQDEGAQERMDKARAEMEGVDHP